MPKLNERLIEEFEKLILFTEEQIAEKTADSNDKFRLKSFKTALDKIKKMDKEITSAEDLDGIKGIGEGVKKRVREILEKGKLHESKVSKSGKKSVEIINSLKQVIGIGDVKAKEFYKEGITSPEDLIKKVKKGKIQVNDVIAMGLKYYPLLEGKIPRKEMKKIEATLLSIIEELDSDIQGGLMGSYRRGLPTSNDIDFTIAHTKLKTKKELDNATTNYIKKIVKKLEKEGYILDSMVLKPNKTYRGFFRLNKKKPVRQIDIKIVPYESYPTALLHSTGPSTFNESMRSLAKKKGYKLNEYGLYKKKDGKLKRKKVKNEKDIFKILEMDYVEPHDRH